MTLRLSLHPSTIDLDSFAARADDAPRRLRHHLAHCVRCQNEVRTLRTLRAAAKALPVPPIGSELFDDVDRRVVQGDLVLLPPANVPARSPRREWIARAGSVAAAAVIAIWMLSQRTAPLVAGETVGELTFTSGAPLAPSTVALTYRPAATLAALDSVVVRASVYKAKAYFSPTAMTFVVHRRNAMFIGDVTLGPEYALGVFTVASPDGKHVDDNDGRTWEFVARDTANRPLFAGLQVQNVIHGFDDWERAYAAAREMVQLYPEEPAAVRALLGESLELGGAARSDSVKREFSPLVNALHRRYANAPAAADLMWQMTMLGNQSGDTAVGRYWFSRIAREYPRDASTIQLTVFAIFNKPMSDLERMRELDKLWDETGGHSLQLVSDAFNLAVRLKDPAGIERWGNRFGTFPGREAAAASEYVRHDELRAKGERLLRNALGGLPPIARTDWPVALREMAKSPPRGQWMLVSLGDALLRDGKPEAARDTLRRAAALGWSADALSLLGSAALAAGDTSEAAQAYAWAVADRQTTAIRADSLRARLGAWASRDAFSNAVSDARSIIREMALAKTFRRPLNGSASFAEQNGTRHALADAVVGKVAVIAVISRHCAPSIKDMPALQSLRDALAPRGVTFVALVAEAPNHATAKEVAALGYSGQVSFDDRSEVSRALRQYGTPAYFVVENGKTIRAEARRAGELSAVIDGLIEK